MSSQQKTWRNRKSKRYKNSPSVSKKKYFGVRKIGSGRLRKPTGRNIIRKLLFVFFFLAIVGTATVSFLFIYYATSLPTVSQIKEGVVVIPESTKIYDRTGEY